MSQTALDLAAKRLRLHGVADRVKLVRGADDDPSIPLERRERRPRQLPGRAAPHPISRCYRADDFLAMCHHAGFEGEAMGGYLSRRELTSLKASWARAIADVRLAPEHRAFLRELTFDLDGFPQHRGRHAGIGGTFRLQRP